MADVVVVGAGFGGVGAAFGAVKAGANVTLLERADMLLGTGLVGGIFRNNGRFTALEEAVEMGAGEIFEIMDRVAQHKNIEFPRHKHASLYNVYKIEPEIRRLLKKVGVNIKLECRVKKCRKNGDRIHLLELDDGEEIKGDSFVDATGTSAFPGNCAKFGNGCVMCILRCHVFKPRISIAEQAGIKEYYRVRPDGTLGSMSGSCKIFKETLSKEIRNELDKRGVMIIPLPKEMIDKHKLEIKACVQYAHPEYVENIILLDTGPAKLMSSYFPLHLLREVPGLENARYEDPLAGGRGNSIRFIGMAPRKNTMQVEGIENLFVAGEKSGPQVGHTEALTTGILAGYNAALKGAGKRCIELPTSTAIGDLIAFINEEVQGKEFVLEGYTYSGGVYFERMKKIGLYTTDVREIQNRVKKAKVTNIFEKQAI